MKPAAGQVADHQASATGALRTPASTTSPSAAAAQIVDLRALQWRVLLDPTGQTGVASLNTAVLNQILATVAPGSWVIMPDDAVYATDDVINVPVDGTVLTGTATILAQNHAGSAVQILGNEVTIQGLRVTGTATTRNLRLSTPASNGFVVEGAGAVLTGVTVRDVAGSGIILIHALLFRLEHPVVVNSQADGIHMTGASAYGVLNQPALFNTGDDGIAVVSYADNIAPTSNITVNDPVVYMSNAPPNYPYTYAWGRGLAVSGGQHITFNNVTTVNSAGAGVFVSAEPTTGWNTMSVSDVVVNGGTLIDSNVDRSLCADPNNPCTNHGAILVWSAQTGRTVSDVRIEGLTIRDTDSLASRQAAIISVPGAGVSHVLFRNLTFINGPSNVFATSADVPPDGYATVCLKYGSTILTNYLGYWPLASPGVTCGTPTR